MAAKERGVKANQSPNKCKDDPAMGRPGYIRILIHKTESFDSEFVRQELVRVFRKSEEEVQAILRAVEIDGAADCGTYARQIAETKVDEVRSDALRRHIRVDMRLSKNDVNRNKAN